MKVGTIGLGKIGFPVAKNMIDSGHEVVGYRRSAMDDFVGARRACGHLSSRSRRRMRRSLLVHAGHRRCAASSTVTMACSASARSGQVVTELGSHPVAAKEAFVAPFRR